MVQQVAIYVYFAATFPPLDLILEVLATEKKKKRKEKILTSFDAFLSVFFFTLILVVIK